MAASREDIDCPGDNITHTCSILSNSEDLFLKWVISPPEVTPIQVTYDSNNISEINVTRNLDMIGSVVLTRYIPPDGIVMDGYIESTLTITLLSADVNRIGVMCATDIVNATEFALFNTSGISL